MPGESGVIDVHYNTNNVGGFSKTVTVTSNAVDNPRVVLRIKGNVKQDAAPQAAPQAKDLKPAPQAKELKAAPAPAKEKEIQRLEPSKLEKKK